MVDEAVRKDREHSTTIRDQTNLNNNLENIRYEDHFLMFTRAGNHAPYLQKVIDYTDGQTLEFGCGTGTQTLAVQPYVDNAVGVELSSDRIELTYERANRMSADTQFIQGDMFELPFDDDTFSTSFNSGIFQHFDNNGIKEIINEVGRVSRDYLILSVANHWYPAQSETRRMKSHEWWCNLFSSYDNYELVEHGTYGNRLDSIYEGVSNFKMIWLGKWVGSDLPYPRSWFVLDIN